MLTVKKVIIATTIIYDHITAGGCVVGEDFVVCSADSGAMPFVVVIVVHTGIEAIVRVVLVFGF